MSQAQPQAPHEDPMGFLLRQRRKVERERRVSLVLLGLAVSLPLHLLIMLWLGSVYVMRPAPPAPPPVTLSLASLAEERLTTVAEQPPFEAPQLDALSAPATSDPSPAINAPAPAAGPAPAGTVDALSIPGAGGGDGAGGEGGPGSALGGGAGHTTFFGVGSRGVRFAYIVDASGSMDSAGKFVIASRELIRSIEALPDFAFYHVCLFSNNFIRPAWQEGWVRARRSDIARTRRWLGEQIPAGATFPLAAFAEVFNLDVPPDVIFFMTDGQIPDGTAQQVQQMNSRGKRVVINTIAFGDESGRLQLQQIAEQSGGDYRFVSPAGY